MKNIYCNFCGKERAGVFYLVEGPGDIHICDECVQLCVDVLAKHRSEKSVKDKAP